MELLNTDQLCVCVCFLLVIKALFCWSSKIRINCFNFLLIFCGADNIFFSLLQNCILVSGKVYVVTTAYAMYVCLLLYLTLTRDTPGVKSIV